MYFNRNHNVTAADRLDAHSGHSVGRRATVVRSGLVARWLGSRVLRGNHVEC